MTHVYLGVDYRTLETFSVLAIIFVFFAKKTKSGRVAAGH